MRPFYLYVNKFGYYLVAFTNKETGIRTPYKSTHSKDYSEAMTIAMKWYNEGVPSENVIRANRVKASDCKINIDNLLTRLTEIEAKTLYEKLGAKFGFSVPVQATADPAPVAVVPAAPVVAPSPSVETPKKKVAATL